MYTRLWTNAVLGSNPANTIDTLLANVREDLNERLTDLFGITSFVADPLVMTVLKLNRTPTPKILGGSTNLTFRNSTDASNNLVLTETGLVISRGVVSSTAISANVTAGSVILGVDAKFMTDDGANVQPVIFYDRVNSVVQIGSGKLSKLQTYNNEAAAAAKDGVVAPYGGGNNKLVWFADGLRFYVAGTSF